MVKYHTDSERENPLPPHGLLFPINSKGLLHAASHRQDCTCHGLCYTRNIYVNSHYHKYNNNNYYYYLFIY